MHLVLITSVINTCEKPLSYSSVRSVFDPETRLAQTLNTIDAVRRRIPHSYIVLIEGSALSAQQCERLEVNVDHVCPAWKAPDVDAAIRSPSKGYGEVMLLLHYLNSVHFIRHKSTFHTISKMSGRYVLTDPFHFDSDHDAVVARRMPQPHGVDFMCTMYYRFPLRLAPDFCDSLKKMLEDDRFVEGHVCIEQSLYQLFVLPRPCHDTSPLGIKGSIAPSGEDINL